MNKRTLTMLVCLTLISVASCATSETDNPVSDYYLARNKSHLEFQVAKGLFHIQAYGTWGFFGSAESARSVWSENAVALCQSAPYKELLVREHFLQRGMLIIQPHKDGYALCKNSALSEDDAIALIEKSRR